MRFSPALSALLAAAALAVPLTFHARAEACGGTFCDGGPQPMPVDQRGENILFDISDGHVEAHIQIQYKGEAQKFAWVLPVQTLPTFEPGSQELFTRLLQSTVPTIGFQNTFDQCTDTKGSPSFGNDSGAGAGGSGTAGSGTGGPPPTVVFQGSVGAFDVTVLSGGDPAEVVKWLDENGFQQNDKAPPILADYLARGYLFAAIKLNGRAGTDEIHPLVVRYAGDTPCVPLKLTAVAAVEDMVVRTFFLGSSRVYPTNYKHVVPSPTALDWTSPAAGYFGAVSKAVDAPVADGHAFMTEYAGPSSVVPATGLSNPKWNAGAFVPLSEPLAIAELSKQGLLACAQPCPGAADDCRLRHPLLEGILARNFVIPDGVGVADHLCKVAEGLATTTYVGSSGLLAKDVDERIIGPAKHAEALLAKATYLTRLVTTISPVEMTEDPEFREVGAVGDVPATQQGTMRTLCTGERVFRFPDGREAYVGKGGGWPVELASMRAALRVETLSSSGQVMTLVDNRAAIDAELAAYNAAHDWPPKGPSFSADGGTGADPDGGCAVGSDGGAATWLTFGALALVALRARRRRD